MKKQFALFIVLAIPLTLITWYSPHYLTGYIPAILIIATWCLAALAVAAHEISRSHRPARAAIAVTVFWLVALTVYTTYWAAVIFLGFGGPQLEHLQIGASPDWLVTDLQFYQHTMLPFLLGNGLIVLIIGPLFGAGAGWLLMQSRVLKPQPLEQAR